MFPPFLVRVWRISETVRLRLSVVPSTRMAIPPGPYPSRVISSYIVPSSSPVPFWMARLMLSAGMLTLFALSTAVRRRGLEATSPPPMRAAIDISRMILVKILPRLASRAPFLCLIDAHLECPDMRDLLGRGRCYHKRKSPDG